MANDETQIKLLTPAEADALLPRIRLALKALRQQRDRILRTQAQVEIEEMTGADSKGQFSPSGQAAVTKAMQDLQSQTRLFEEKLREMFGWGAHLKDLDGGLVDFYCLREGEVVFLCWKEGEAKITHWHSLQGGFANRKPLNGH